MTKFIQGGAYGCYVSSLGIVATVVVVCRQPTATNAFSNTPYFVLPSTTMEEFTVFALNDGGVDSSRHNTIHFGLRLSNRLSNVAVYYDALNLTFYHKPNNVDKYLVGNATIESFYERANGDDIRKGNFEVRGVRWENISTSPVMFRVELVTMVRHNTYYLWKSKRQRYEVGADLKVNDQGFKII